MAVRVAKAPRLPLVEARDASVAAKIGPLHPEEPLKARVVTRKLACAKRKATRQTVEKVPGETRREEKEKEKKPRVKKRLPRYKKISVSAAKRAFLAPREQSASGDGRTV